MKFVHLFVFSILILQQAIGQHTIGGQVSDEHGVALFGVNIYIKDTYDGASSGQNGEFSFKTDELGQQTMVASFIGYKTYEAGLEVNQDYQNIQITLSEEINKIDGVTITAGAFEASDKKKSVILKTFDIVTTAGAIADITGVMNTLPGTQTVGEEGRLFVRGGAGHEAKTFINGLLVAQPYEITPNNIPSRFRFSPFLFKGAFFSTGGYSAEYGQALSSVLQLNTYDLPARSQTDISIMTVGTDISQTIRKNNTSLYGQIQYTDLTPSFALIPQKYEWERAPNSLNSTLHFKQKLAGKGDIQAYANYDRSSMILNQPIPGNIYEQARFDIHTQNLYTNLSINNSLGQSMSYHGGVAYSVNRNQMAMDDLYMDTNIESIHTKLVFDQDVTDNIQLKYGGEWVYDQYEEVVFDQENQPVQKLNFDNNMISPFAEANIFFSNKIVARVGARYEYNEIIDSEHIDPRASLAYKLDQNSQFSMAYGRFSQLPIGDYLKRSTQLSTEMASHYILNYQFAKGGRIFRSEVYYKKYDKLTTSELVSDQGIQFDNSGYGDASGLELFWRDSKTFENVEYWISYSYLDTERKYDIFPYPVMPYYASAHNLSIVYKQFITSIKSMIGATYSFASGRPYTDPNTGEFNSMMTKNYNDLSVNYSYLVKPNLILHASVSNVFGFQNVYGYQYNAKQNGNGIYESIPIQPQAKRFLFVGFFITISKDKNANQLNNL